MQTCSFDHIRPAGRKLWGRGISPLFSKQRANRLVRFLFLLALLCPTKPGRCRSAPTRFFFFFSLPTSADRPTDRPTDRPSTDRAPTETTDRPNQLCAQFKPGPPTGSAVTCPGGGGGGLAWLVSIPARARTNVDRSWLAGWIVAGGSLDVSDTLCRYPFLRALQSGFLSLGSLSRKPKRPANHVRRSSPLSPSPVAECHPSPPPCLCSFMPTLIGTDWTRSALALRAAVHTDSPTR